MKSLPCKWVPLVVWRARRINALVTSSHVEAHPVGSTLDVLLQTLVNICKHGGKKWRAGLNGGCGVDEGDGVTWLGVCRTLTSLAVGHEAVPGGTEASVAPWCVHALMLTGVSHLALIDVWSRCTQERPSRRIAQTTLEDTHAVLFFYSFGRKKPPQFPFFF